MGNTAKEMVIQSRAINKSRLQYQCFLFGVFSSSSVSHSHSRELYEHRTLQFFIHPVLQEALLLKQMSFRVQFVNKRTSQIRTSVKQQQLLSPSLFKPLFWLLSCSFWCYCIATKIHVSPSARLSDLQRTHFRVLL